MQAPQERPLVIGKSAYFEVRSLNLIKVIIPHFIKYPLMTQKCRFSTFQTSCRVNESQRTPLSFATPQYIPLAPPPKFRQLYPSFFNFFFPFFFVGTSKRAANKKIFFSTSFATPLGQNDRD